MSDFVRTGQFSGVDVLPLHDRDLVQITIVEDQWCRTEHVLTRDQTLLLISALQSSLATFPTSSR